MAAPLLQAAWQPIGPNPTTHPRPSPFNGYPTDSGRVTALAFDPRDTSNQTIYLGAAEGGVWKTTDGGQHWTPLMDFQPSLAVGAIALDPSTNPTTIYVGTGEENFSGDAYYGAGVFKSTDGGQTWTQDSTFSQAAAKGIYGGGPYIGGLAVAADNPQILLAAVKFAYGSSLPSGVWRSTDGGKTWTVVLTGAPATAVAFDPAQPGLAWAALSDPFSNTAKNNIYKSTDDGATWTPVFPPGMTYPYFGRITLAVGPPASSGAPGIVVAAVADATTFSANLLGILLSTDGGATWTSPLVPTFCNPQCFYDMAVGIHPKNPNIIYLGGANQRPLYNDDVLVVSTDRGNTWSSDLAAGGGSPPNPNGQLHTDVHAIAFSPDGTVLAVGTDGGVWTTTNVGVASNITWMDRNATLALTQFYPGISIFPKTTVFRLQGIGGTQDNSTQARMLSDGSWEEIVCGDGAATAITPDGSIFYFACAAGGGIWKVTSSSVFPAVNGIGTCSTNPSPGCYTTNFVPPLAMDPQNASRLYFAARATFGSALYLYQTNDGATSWQPISPDLSGGVATEKVTAIAVAPSDSNTVWVGTFQAALWRSTNATMGAGSSWAPVSSSTLPHRVVTSIAIDPNNAQTVYVAYSGFGSCAACDHLGHIFKTTDGGNSWTDVSGSLPDIPVNVVVLDPAVRGVLYAATDVGVFASLDDGATWLPLANQLPNVAVLGLTVDPGTRTLWAGTHGRSMWSLALPAPPTATPSSTSVSFGNQAVATTASQTVTLTNSGALPLGITSIGISGSAAFSETHTCGTTLAAGASCTITVSFAPTAAGAASGTLTINDNLRSGPTTIALSGTGVVPTVGLSANALNFSAQAVGSTSSGQTVTVSNTSSVLLVINSITVSGPFAQTNTCGNQVAAGASCTITVTFTPTAAGAASGTLAINDNGANSPQQVALSGTGQDFTVSASPASATVHPGSSATFTITVSGQAQAGFNGSVALACSGLPNLANCTFSPASVTPGSGGATSTLTISTTAPSLLPSGPSRPLPPWPALLVLGAALGWLLWRVRGRAVRWATLAAILALAAGAIGCGGGGPSGPHNPGTPTGTYTVTVTGSSGSLQHATNVTLTVQ